MKKVLFFTLLLSCFCLKSPAQHVYPEVYDHCYLDEFEFETDKLIARMKPNTLIETVSQSWSKKMVDKAEGYLGLQILVDKRGNSCLVSVRNDTNLNLKKLDLNKSIADNLKWPRMSGKICVIVLLEFKDGQISMKRLGTQDMRNLVEIKEN